MKTIAAFLLATFVAFSSFAETRWTAIGKSNLGYLSMRNLSDGDGKGNYTVDFRIDYTTKVVSSDGDDVDRSFMKVSMNCFSRDSKLLSDVHVSDGKVLTKFSNQWTISGVGAPTATSAGNIVMTKICKTI